MTTRSGELCETLLEWHQRHELEVVTDGTVRSWVVVPYGQSMDGHLGTCIRMCSDPAWHVIDQPERHRMLLPTYGYDRVVVAGVRCGAAVRP